MDIKGTRTEANLMSAFAGETQARSKYTYFAEAARKEGFEKIAEIFEATAENERSHAFMWFELLGGMTNTTGNLKNAASGEHFEWEDMYRRFAEEAEQEGFKDIARKFRQVADIEAWHEKRFLQLLSNTELQQVFERTSEVMWECRNCGHLVIGKKAPEKCPVCSYPKSYFQIHSEEY
ncbi:MAG: rubrerythrin family protein [Oscillospiraceae bacterium]|nr:rubrerythrin family protein [Oscillospiraceae bacterium]